MEETRQHSALAADRGSRTLTVANDDADPAGRRRLRGFLVHLVAYFAVMVVLVAVNLVFTPAQPWFVWPMVGWGGVLAVHVAYVMFGGR